MNYICDLVYVVQWWIRGGGVFSPEFLAVEAKKNKTINLENFWILSTWKILNNFWEHAQTLQKFYTFTYVFADFLK